jgi:hypothetical protein
MTDQADLPPSIALVTDPRTLLGGFFGGGDPYEMLTQGKSAAETTGPAADGWREISQQHDR